MSKKKEQEKKTRKASRWQIEQLAAQIADEMAVGLFGRTEEYAANVGRYYSIAVDELLKLSARVELDPESEVFSFSDNKRMSEKSNAILRGLYSAVYQEIRSGVIREWENANAARDRLVELVMGKGARDDKRFASLFARNREAMEAFFRRKNEYGGLNLSQKVWKYTSQFKEEMELALSASLGRGDSAATVSRHVRQYLQEPDRLFRRVRDEEGNLKLSKRAAAYHPGRGEYRSSYRNAMRLARTETNMAYRSADYERRQRHPWIVGVEVKRVHDKTVCKLCDALAGKYPKDFKFVGWHPQCRCYTIDVLAPVEEVNAYHRAMLDGEDVSGWQFSGQITEPHAGFQNWMKENQERIGKAAEKGTLPYWMKDNPQYVKVNKMNQPVKNSGDNHETTGNLTEIKKRIQESDNVTLSDTIEDFSNLATGRMLRSEKTLGKLLWHCRSLEEINAAMYAWEHPESLTFIEPQALGAVKDMSNPVDVANVRNKWRHGVREYEIYRLDYNDVSWRVKTQKHKKGFEMLYHIMMEQK